MAITLQFVAALQNPAPAAGPALSAPGAADAAGASALPFAALFDKLLKPQDLSAQLTDPAAVAQPALTDGEAETAAELAADPAAQALLASLSLLPVNVPAPVTTPAGGPAQGNGEVTEAGQMTGAVVAQTASLLPAAPEPATPAMSSGAGQQFAEISEQAAATPLVTEPADGENLPQVAANLAAVPAAERGRLQLTEVSLADVAPEATPVPELNAPRPLAAAAQPASPAPVAHAQYHIPEPVAGSRWADALGQRAMFMVEQQVKTAELHLNPPHLGPLEVKLALDGDKASLSFSTSQAAVREAVQQSLPRLQQVFADNGMAELNVQIHLGQQNQPQQQQRQFAGDYGQDEQSSSPERSLVVDMAAVQRSRWQVQSYASARGGVDTFA